MTADTEDSDPDADETDAHNGDPENGNDTVTDEFVAFLQEYGVIGLAIGVVMGTATKDLVNAVVADVIMPVIGLLLAGDSWRTATVFVGPVELGIGHLIGAVLDFLIIAFIVYLFIKYILGKEKIEKV